MTRGRLLAILLVAPALLLVGFGLIVPLLINLATAVRDPEMAKTLPETTAILTAWNGQGLPPDAAFDTVARELARASSTPRIGALANRLEFARPGFAALLAATAHADLRDPTRDALVSLDPRWGDPATWRVMRQAIGPVTPIYFLRSLDLDLAPDGKIVRAPADRSIFGRLFLRTLWVSLGVTVLTLLIAYPVAYALATLERTWARIGLALVLVAFWIPILVRTAAWFFLLQRAGLADAPLLALGITGAPLHLIAARFAVCFTLVNVLLPFAIVPIFLVMRRIDAIYSRVAASLGAPALMRFTRIYLPMTMPGVAVSALISFVLALGYYATPMIVGGPDDQLVGTAVARYATETTNLGMAAALATLLLLMTVAIIGAARLALPRRA